MEHKRRKALNFDLDIALLKQYYPKRFYNQAYNDIKRFLLKNGFRWRQGSGYCSEQALSKYDVQKVIFQMNKAFPWLAPCVKQFDVTDIGNTYSLLPMFNPSSVSLENEKESTITFRAQRRQESLADLVRAADESRLHQGFAPRQIRDPSEQQHISL